MASLSFTYQGKLVVVDSDIYTSISENFAGDLNFAAKHFAEVGLWLADAQRQKDLAKESYDAHWGERYRMLRNGEYERLYGKKPTEESLQNALYEHPSLRDMKQAIIELDAVISQLFTLRKAVEIKFDALKEIGSHIRLDKRGTIAQMG